MSTRKAKDDSVFHQNRYASSPEFERGLMANLVAKRCSLLDAKSDRELIWFIQYLSHQAGGLSALTKDIIKKYPDRIQTRAMLEIGAAPGQIYNADQVRKIRKELPDECESGFLLKGEMPDGIVGIILAKRVKTSQDWECDQVQIAESELQPESYPAALFLEKCRAAAHEDVERHLREICLNPAIELADGPWYFPGLISTLREYMADFIKLKSAGGVITALGQKVCEALDYTAYGRGLTLMEGDPRLGKSFAGRAWCEQHPGQARFVEVPPSNDEASFFRALARGLGLGNFLKYKVSEIRERVESVLLTGDVLLVLDEAQRLWPQRNLRYGFPSRIVWVMAMVNAEVPICMISTPQFTVTQKAVEKNGWNSAQLTGRISFYEPLPAELSPEDLMAVAKTVLPEANTQTLSALAAYARSSARYLAAIDAIAKRARYIAMRDSRDLATTDDVRKAMKESVIPADSKLLCALENGRTKKPVRMTPAPELPSAQFAGPEESEPVRSRIPAHVPGSRIRAGTEAPLVEA